MKLKVIIAGQKWFGNEVLRTILHDYQSTISVEAVCSPIFNDRMTETARKFEIPIIPAGTLSADKIPSGLDLGITAHSHDFIGRASRYKCKFGWIGYHPSLLPVHRGRDAVKWAIKMNERITGGSVYWLNSTVDGGDIASQEHVFIRPDDTAEELWRRELAPLGIKLIRRSLNDIIAGHFIKVPQDKSLSTWEPSLNPPKLMRPDLLMLNENNKSNGKQGI